MQPLYTTDSERWYGFTDGFTDDIHIHTVTVRLGPGNEAKHPPGRDRGAFTYCIDIILCPL